MTGGDWGDEGNIVIGTGGPPPLVCCSCPQREAQATPMLELANGELFHVKPQILPGGKAILVQAVARARPGQLHRRRRLRRRSRPQDTRTRSRRLLVTCRVVISSTRRKRRCSPCHSTWSEWKRVEPPSRFWTTSHTTRLRNGAQFDVSQHGTLVYRRRSGVLHPRDRAVARSNRQAGTAARHPRRVLRHAPRVARWQAHRDRH